MEKKFLTISSLALLQIVIIGNLQVLPANASYGSFLPFLYLIAVVGFFIPCSLMVAELATTRPQTGGAYIWCEQAFGPKIGFFTVCILWLSNLLWYPSIFSLIATNIAYLFNISLAQNKSFIISVSLALFWLFTGLNCLGIKFSSKASMVCSIVGIILPMLIIIVGGISWGVAGNPLAISLEPKALIPHDFTKLNLGLLIGIAISLFGVELTAVHAGNVINPRRNFPMSLLISGIILIFLLLCGELAIALIIPAEKLSLVTGLLDALILLFRKLHLALFILPILLLTLLGNIGSVAAWMLGSTRGMAVACQRNKTAAFLQKVNRYESPIGVLVFEAIIFTLATSVFFIFPHITDSFWLMLALASQVTLVYYTILFLSAIRLRYLPPSAKGFLIPGGNKVIWIIMLLGATTSIIALIAGFFPPEGLDQTTALRFTFIMLTGLLVSICLPILLLLWKKN